MHPFPSRTMPLSAISWLGRRNLGNSAVFTALSGDSSLGNFDPTFLAIVAMPFSSIDPAAARGNSEEIAEGLVYESSITVKMPCICEVNSPA